MKVDNLNKKALTNTFLKEQEVCQTIKSLELFQTDAANDCIRNFMMRAEGKTDFCESAPPHQIRNANTGLF